MAFTKQPYETPASELLEVRTEHCFVYVLGAANYSDTSGGVSGDDYYDDYDL